MRMIIGRSFTPLKFLRTLRGVRRRQTGRRSDDNSRKNLRNVRGDSSARRRYEVLIINTDKMLTHVAAAAPTAPTSTASPAIPARIPTFALDKPSAGVIIGASWAG